MYIGCLSDDIFYGHSLEGIVSGGEIDPDSSNVSDPQKLSELFAGRKKALYTFDDGFSSLLDVLLPLLEEFHLTALLFVTTGYVERTSAPVERMLAAMINDREGFSLLAEIFAGDSMPARGRQALYDVVKKHLRRCGLSERNRWIHWMLEKLGSDLKFFVSDMLTVKDMRFLGAHPLIEIGSHTHSHPSLPSLKSKEIDRELLLSKEKIENWVAGRPTKIAYPYGAHNSTVKSRVKKAGFDRGYTTDPRGLRRNKYFYGKYAVPRIDLNKALEQV